MKILTLIATPAPMPSVLVLEPDEAPVREGISRTVPIFIGPPEAISLSAALEGGKTERPLTHDLMMDALTCLDATVDHIVINDVKGDVFYAAIVMKQHGRLIKIDARPSDAINLAVREGSPIFMTEPVLDGASYPYLYRGKRDTVAELDDFKDFLENLSPDDFS